MKSVCPGCGTELGVGLFACPACHRLVHQEKLKALAAQATAAASAGSLTAEITAWREALELLPAGSKQADTVAAKIGAVRERIDAGEPDHPMPAPGSGEKGPPLPGSAADAAVGAAAGAAAGSGSGSRWGLLAALGFLAWKFKFVVVFLLTKAKLLLAGLTKLPTLLSMFVWVQVYWQAHGWPLAVGVMLCIYIHEMGHIAAITRYGMRASAPMFIPGFGALIRLSSRPADATEDARIGLAGPLWGLGATVAVWLAFRALDYPVLGAIAHVSAVLNLFNLVPIWELDGGRGIRALSGWQRVFLLSCCILASTITNETMTVFIAIGIVGHLVFGKSPKADAGRPFAEFVFLVLALSLFSGFAPNP